VVVTGAESDASLLWNREATIAAMPENSKAWFRLRWRSMLLLVIAGTVGWSAYSYWSEYREQAARKAREIMAPTAGSQCTVLYRKEALGAIINRLTPVQIEGAFNDVQGKFVKLNDDWIVLIAANGQQLWVPRDHVLLMRVE